MKVFDAEGNELKEGDKVIYAWLNSTNQKVKIARTTILKIIPKDNHFWIKLHRGDVYISEWDQGCATNLVKDKE